MKFSFIWDMDGTLVDSYPSIVPSVKTVCEAYGADYDQKFIHDSVIHTSVGDFFRKMAKEYGLNPEELTGRFNHLNDTNIDSILPIPHAEETLKLLCEKGHQNFVFTHRGASCRAILEKTGLLSYFTEIITALDGFPRKPEPDAILYLVQKYHLSPSHSFYVGDRKIDMEAAVNAGIGGILYLDAGNPGSLSGNEAFVISDLLEITRITQK